MKFSKDYVYGFIKGFNYIYLTIPILTLIYVCIVSYKALSYRSKIDTYEEYFITIESKEDSVVDYDYNNKFLSLDEYRDSEVKKYINCLNKEISNEELNDEIKLSMKTLENLFNSSINNFAFKYTDIYTGFTVSYNEKQEIFTASTIKAPMAIYLYEKAEDGFVDLDEKLFYTSNYYNTGSGILKNKPFNESYTIRDLISYAIIPSDNAAHNMLMDNFGRDGMYDFWIELGTTSIFKQYSNWGVTNANDATIYMKELYDYYNTDTDLSNELMQNFINVTFKPLSGKNKDLVIANKSGWTGSVFHDAAIIFDDNPYILVVLSNTGRSDYTYLFNLTSDLVAQLHQQYWKFKYDVCRDIIDG